MKIDIVFPEGTKAQDIMKVLAALVPLEQDGIEFNIVFGKLGHVVNSTPGPLGPEVPHIDVPIDVESLIGKPLPGVEEQEVQARRGVYRVDE